MTGFKSPEDLLASYYAAMYEADTDALRTIFQPGSRVSGFFADRFIDSDLDRFVTAISAAPSAQSQNEPPHLEIMDLRIDGRIGTAIVRDTLHGVTYVDHLALAHLDDGWRIASKVYVTPTPLPQP